MAHAIYKTEPQMIGGPYRTQDEAEQQATADDALKVGFCIYRDTEIPWVIVPDTISTNPVGSMAEIPIEERLGHEMGTEAAALHLLEIAEYLGNQETADMRVAEFNPHGVTVPNSIEELQALDAKIQAEVERRLTDRAVL